MARLKKGTRQLLKAAKFMRRTAPKTGFYAKGRRQVIAKGLRERRKKIPRVVRSLYKLRGT